MTDEETRLHEFILRVAERLYLASSVLGHLAEKRTKKGSPVLLGLRSRPVAPQFSAKHREMIDKHVAEKPVFKFTWKPRKAIY
jgi:hypothetical protein